MKTISDVRGDMLRDTGGFLILTKSVKEIYLCLSDVTGCRKRRWLIEQVSL